MAESNNAVFVVNGTSFEDKTIIDMLQDAGTAERIIIASKADMTQEHEEDLARRAKNGAGIYYVNMDGEVPEFATRIDTMEDGKTALRQVSELTDTPLNVTEELIDAYYTGDIAGMTERAKDLNMPESMQNNVIQFVLQEKRMFYEIDEIEETKAEEAIRNAKTTRSGITVIEYDGNDRSPITDRLYAQADKGILIVKDGENAHFYGPENVCSKYKEGSQGMVSPVLMKNSLQPGTAYIQISGIPAKTALKELDGMMSPVKTAEREHVAGSPAQKDMPKEKDAKAEQTERASEAMNKTPQDGMADKRLFYIDGIAVRKVSQYTKAFARRMTEYAKRLFNTRFMTKTTDKIAAHADRFMFRSIRRMRTLADALEGRSPDKSRKISRFADRMESVRTMEPEVRKQKAVEHTKNIGIKAKDIIKQSPQTMRDTATAANILRQDLGTVLKSAYSKAKTERTEKGVTKDKAPKRGTDRT